MRHPSPTIRRNRVTPQPVPEYSICLVREPIARFKTNLISRSKAFYRTFKKAFDGLDREIFTVVTVDAKNIPIGFNVVSMGSLTMSIVHPREVFKMAVLQNAARVFLAHNLCGAPHKLCYVTPQVMWSRPDAREKHMDMRESWTFAALPHCT